MHTRYPQTRPVVFSILAAALLSATSCGKWRDPGTGDETRGEASRPEPTAPSDPHPKIPGGLLDRVVVIGASVSAGFKTQLPIAALIETAIPGPHQAVVDASEALMGTNPIQVGDAQIHECLEEDATLVIALDFLFWFAYGLPAEGDRELPRRRARFERGLAHLDRLNCPVVVGALPDMRDGQSYITPAQVPGEEALAALNQDLREYCASRDHVFLVPLDDWVRDLKSGGWSIPDTHAVDGSTRNLSAADALSDDRLHPSRTGTLVLVHQLVLEIERQLGARFGAPVGLAFDLRRNLRLLAR